MEWKDIFPESSQGTALRGARYKENMSQKQLADQAGLSVKQLSALENNKAKIEISQAKKIAKLLNVNHKIFLESA